MLLVAMEADLLMQEQMLVEEQQRSRTMAVRARNTNAHADAQSSTRSRDSRLGRDRRPPSVSTRSGRAVQELDDDIRDEEEADRWMAHELATTARLNV